jgi:hypothetical protein
MAATIMFFPSEQWKSIWLWRSQWTRPGGDLRVTLFFLTCVWCKEESPRRSCTLGLDTLAWEALGGLARNLAPFPLAGRTLCWFRNALGLAGFVHPLWSFLSSSPKWQYPSVLNSLKLPDEILLTLSLVAIFLGTGNLPVPSPLPAQPLVVF